ncbi:MAG: ATP-binding cassette domain-containing protein, partial [Nitriliruptoraceae bacterium]
MIALEGVGVTIDGATILDGVDLRVAAREHLAVLGPNGSGKTTLLRVLSTYRYPSHGQATVLGTRFGRGDLRRLRPRIGFVSTALDQLLHTRAPALPLVAAARRGGTWPPPHVLEDPATRAAAEREAARGGCGRKCEALKLKARQRAERLAAAKRAAELEDSVIPELEQRLKTAPKTAGGAPAEAVPARMFGVSDEEVRFWWKVFLVAAIGMFANLGFGMAYDPGARRA